MQARISHRTVIEKFISTKNNIISVISQQRYFNRNFASSVSFTLNVDALAYVTLACAFTKPKLIL
jgi:hypothetical protein